MYEDDTQLAIHQKLFLRDDDTFSIWDHPNFKSHMVLPDDYRPLYSLMSVLEAMNRWSADVREKRMTVLKVIGDAMCANESQIRRYLAPLMSSSDTSKQLLLLRKHGFVERHKARIAFLDDEESIRPPAPYTLGPAGYLLMKHYYSSTSFANSESWQGNSFAIQRVVALNELRCVAAASKILANWKWYPNVGGSNKYPSPAAVFDLRSANGELVEMHVIRAQVAQNFLPFIKKILECYRYLYNKDQRILVDNVEDKEKYQIVLLSVSNKNVAKYLIENLALESYPFEIWFIIDEEFEGTIVKEAVERIGSAFYRIEKDVLIPLHLEFSRNN